MAATNTYGRLVVNIIGLLSNLYGFSFMLNLSSDVLGYGGMFQFLTIIGLTLATIAFAIKIIRFIIPGSLGALYKFVVYVATPMEGLITLLYWPMIFYSKDLLQAEDMPFVLPLSVDMSMHFWPAFLLYVDFFLFDADFERSKTHIGAIYIFTLAYLGWTTLCFSRNGFWVYPFLADFSHMTRAMFFIFCGNVCAVMYEAGAFVHSKIQMRRMITERRKTQ
ncbi:FAR-17a/AIG1-like protein [Syncephalastrum racemosum]|uniref:FAR-17a/AIG1-like protein n=1 Tax=Syncephalastrum racemosum TaxID=13706 RepID=A0A1X2HQG3_SYNRA|nr:FAR-17a/AIG1-like protein [Syncephalastrum racemosum]